MFASIHCIFLTDQDFAQIVWIIFHVVLVFYHYALSKMAPALQ